jgi:hypothetical protein
MVRRDFFRSFIDALLDAYHSASWAGLSACGGVDLRDVAVLQQAYLDL